MSQLTEAEVQRDHLELQKSLERLCIPNIPIWFKREQIAGKGLGFVATTEIPRGTPLMAETALFFVEDVSTPRLSSANKRSIRGYAKDFPQFQELVCNAVPPSDYSRSETNNFQMGQNRNGRYTWGIFLEASRFNHSCVPNAYFAWNPTLNNGQGQLTIYAIQDIYAGNEILINYRPKDCFKLRDARHAKLNKIYGFICDCPACQPGHQFGAMSDGRRGRMQDLQTEIDGSTDSSTPGEREAKRENINKLIGNLKQEGIVYPQLADALDELGELANEELRVGRTQINMSAAAYVSRLSHLNIADS